MTNSSWLQNIQDYGSTKWGQTKEAIGNVFTDIKEWWIEPKDDELTDLKLHIYGTETMSLTADVTDNYVESNIAYQDHIALKPKVFTITGEVGELTWFRKDEEHSELLAVPQKLYPVVSFLPPIAKQARAIQDTALKVLGVLDSVDNFASRFFGLLDDEDADTEQKKIYKYLMVLWQRRVPVNVRTPFGKIENYVIQNIEFTQPDRTVDKSQIKISLKEFKTVIEKRSRVDSKKLQGRKSAQQAKKQSKGTTTGASLSYVECKPGSVFVDNETGRTIVVGGIKK